MQKIVRTKNLTAGIMYKSTQSFGITCSRLLEEGGRGLRDISDPVDELRQERERNEGREGGCERMAPTEIMD